METATINSDDKIRLFDIPEVCARTRLSRAEIYKRLDSGSLKAIKIGKRCLIKAADLRDFIERQPAR